MEPRNRSLSDEESFNMMYGNNVKPLHAYFVGKTNDKEAALDLLQEVFAKAWRNIGELGGLPPENQRWWLFSAARRLVVDYYRRPKMPCGDSDAMASDNSPGADSEYERKEALKQLNRAIKELPADLRVVLLMSALGGMNSGEIGSALGKPPGTVRYQIHKARAMLAKAVGEKGDKGCEL